jgi:hypothetical protein
MELKHIVQRYAYRIEEKPEGGFIARVTDPSVPPLEAPTREELQQKIQSKVVAELGAMVPALKRLEPGKQVSFSMHVDRKPGGGFSVHTDDPGTPEFNSASHEKMDHYAEELLGFLDKHFPQLSEQFASQVVGRELPIVVTETTTTTTKAASLSRLFVPTTPATANAAQGSIVGDATGGASGMDPALLTNAPITPEASKSSAVLRFVVMLLIVAAVMYFYLHH